MIWKHPVNLEQLNQMNKGTILEQIGIEFTEIGEDYLQAKMPVDHRTVQPMGILHGGASVVLSESIGSSASFLCIENIGKQTAVGVEVNANHLRSAREGYVIGEARPIRIGRTLHVWNIEIKDEAGRMICVSRLTMAVIDRR